MIEYNIIYILRLLYIYIYIYIYIVGAYNTYSKSDHSAEYGSSNNRELRPYKIIYKHKLTYFLY